MSDQQGANTGNGDVLGGAGGQAKVDNLVVAARGWRECEYCLNTRCSASSPVVMRATRKIEERGQGEEACYHTTLTGFPSGRVSRTSEPDKWTARS